MRIIEGRMPKNRPWLRSTETTTTTDWTSQFYQEHGRASTREDVSDKAWSEQFLRTYGRPPSKADWEARWYAKRGGRPGVSSGGGGATQPTVADILGEIQFPTFREQVHPMLRDFVRYVEELMSKSGVTPAFPFPVEQQDQESEFYQRQRQLAQQLGLDLQQLKEKTPTEQWQTFLDTLKKPLNVEAQQRLLGLRWNPESGWSFESPEMIPNIKYM